jgi:hypothetical protein
LEYYETRNWQKKNINEDIHALNIEGNITNNHQVIADSFNNYFLSVAEKLITNNKSNNCNNNTLNNCSIFFKKFKNPLPIHNT